MSSSELTYHEIISGPVLWNKVYTLRSWTNHRPYRRSNFSFTALVFCSSAVTSSSLSCSWKHNKNNTSSYLYRLNFDDHRVDLSLSHHYHLCRIYHHDGVKCPYGILVTGHSNQYIFFLLIITTIYFLIPWTWTRTAKTLFTHKVTKW